MIDLVLAQALIYLSWITIVMVFGLFIMYWCIFIGEVWKRKVLITLRIILSIVVFFIITALIIITIRVCNMTSDWVYTLIMK